MSAFAYLIPPGLRQISLLPRRTQHQSAVWLPSRGV